MHKTKLISFALATSALLFACQWQAPTSPAGEGKISLALDFAQWQEHKGDGDYSLARTQALAVISRLDIFVLFDKDTLARATTQVVAGSNEFSAVLEVPIGAERRVIVEAWDDLGGEGGPVRAFRGVQTNVEILPNVAREVAITLYPLPVIGQSVVLIVGAAQGAPGTSGHLVPVTLISADSLSGVQFDLNYDANLIAPVAALRNTSLAFDTLASNIITSEPGQPWRVLFFSLSGKRLPALLDPSVMMNLSFKVNESATVGAKSNLLLSNLAVLDHTRRRLGVFVVEEGGFEVVGGR